MTAYLFSALKMLQHQFSNINNNNDNIQ